MNFTVSSLEISKENCISFIYLAIKHCQSSQIQFKLFKNIPQTLTTVNLNISVVGVASPGKNYYCDECHATGNDLKGPFGDSAQQYFVPEEATLSIEKFELAVDCESLNWII